MPEFADTLARIQNHAIQIDVLATLMLNLDLSLPADPAWLAPGQADQLRAAAAPSLAAALLQARLRERALLRDWETYAASDGAAVDRLRLILAVAEFAEDAPPPLR